MSGMEGEEHSVSGMVKVRVRTILSVCKKMCVCSNVQRPED